MSIIMGAIAGAGEAGEKYFQQEQKTDNETKLAGIRSDLDLQRTKLIDSLKERSAIASEQRAEEPLKRFGTALGVNQQGEVPMTAAPVTSLAGKQGQNNVGGDLSSGFTGDLSSIKADIMAMPEGLDKTQAMKQLKSQFDAETDTANKGIIGQARKITPDEALSKTIGETLANDPVALAAYEKSIGKSSRDDRRLDLTEIKNDARAVAASKESDRKALVDSRRYENELKRLDLQQGTLDSGNRKIDAWITNEGEKRDNDASKAEGGGKGQSPDKLGAIVNAMNATISNLDNGARGKTPEEKTEWQRQRDTAVRVRDRASGLLDTSLSDRGAPETPEKPSVPTAKPAASNKPAAAPSGLPAGAKQIGTSGGKAVYQLANGDKVIQN